MKLLIIIMIVYIINKMYRIKKKYKIPMCDADIVLSPGGIKGPYNLGICHYLKNHFDITGKKIVGFSSGSINNVFLALNKEKNNDFLKVLMKNKLNNDIKGYLVKTVNTINLEFTEKDFDLNLINIGVTHTDGLQFYNKFLNLNDLLKCCISSSFIPLITYRDVLYFYNYKLSLDGGTFYNSYIKNSKGLIINHYMFKRYKKTGLSDLKLLNPKNLNTYQMYLNGYHDARKNHNYFLNYLNPL